METQVKLKHWFCYLGLVNGFVCDKKISDLKDQDTQVLVVTVIGEKRSGNKNSLKID